MSRMDDMQKVYASVDRLTGRTPLVELSRTQERLGLKARVLAKLEGLNPAGSIKDRTAKAMIDTAEAQEAAAAGAVIIEPTSGNTGIRVNHHCRCQRLPRHLGHAGHHVTGTAAIAARLRRTAGADPGDEGMQGALPKQKR